jgi:hypothetical protein
MISAENGPTEERKKEKDDAAYGCNITLLFVPELDESR